MEQLKAEIERKRKEQPTAAAAGRNKYMKRGEVERLAAAEAAAAASREKAADAAPVAVAAAPSASAAALNTLSNTSTLTSTANTSTANTSTEKRIPEADLAARFRARGVPIRLFGETHADRMARLTALESSEERSDGGQNDYRALLARADARLAETLLKGGGGGGGAAAQAKAALEAQLAAVDTRAISQRLLDRDPEKTRILIAIYFKKILLVWERTLNETDADSKDKRFALATREQTAEYMKPFFVQLKQGSLENDVVARVTEICKHMQDREYLKANDAYLRLSIGNAPWPIGVTMVGIHERSGREKISSSHVAHGLNDETQRKWIQSIKRMMTFAQSIYPPDDLGKAIG
ncbi:Prp18 domain-containing protein [Obelidium mucronatum]|nr:Prp18 domain-containing protein [Obelidium mucronatum]